MLCKVKEEALLCQIEDRIATAWQHDVGSHRLLHSGRSTRFWGTRSHITTLYLHTHLNHFPKQHRYGILYKQHSIKSDYPLLFNINYSLASTPLLCYANMDNRQ
jgi:hypothetical protein